jgi:hypothetical protein
MYGVPMIAFRADQGGPLRNQIAQDTNFMLMLKYIGNQTIAPSGCADRS